MESIATLFNSGRPHLADQGSPAFHLTTTDAGARFSKFSSCLAFAADALPTADMSVIKSASAPTVTANSFEISLLYQTNTGIGFTKSARPLLKVAGSFAKSAFSPAVIGSYFTKSATPFVKSADALPVSEHYFQQALASKVSAFDRPRLVCPQLPQIIAKAKPNLRPSAKFADFPALSPVSNHQPLPSTND